MSFAYQSVFDEESGLVDILILASSEWITGEELALGLMIETELMRSAEPLFKKVSRRQARDLRYRFPSNRVFECWSYAWTIN